MPLRTVLVWLSALGAACGLMLGYWKRTPPPPPEGIASMIDLSDRQDLNRLQALHPGTILLDFHARWCKPCAELMPRLVKLGRHHPEIVIAGVDAAEQGGLADAFAVDGLPTLIRLEHGHDTARLVGAPTLAELERWLETGPTSTAPPSATTTSVKPPASHLSTSVPSAALP